MRAALLAFAAGALGARWWPGPPPAEWACLLALGGLAALLCRLRPATWLGCALAGLAWALLAAIRVGEGQLAAELDGRTVWLEGTVTSLPVRSEATVIFTVQGAVSRRGALPSLIRVTWRNGPVVRSGERWRLAVTLSAPRGLVNPGGFDYEAWLFAQGLGATGTVKAGERLAAGPPAVREAVRERLLASKVQAAIPLLVALVLGDDSGITAAQWRVLQATGTVHLFVISGQHVGLVAGLVYGLVAWLARRRGWPGRLPWLPCACLGAGGAALGYGALAGFEVPVQRACLMILVTLVWRWRFRHIGVFTPLVLALAAVLAVNPLVSLTPGFWLSFSAVAVLLLAFAGRLGRWAWWQAWWRAQWCIAVGLAVVMAALGLAVSLTGPVVNLVAVPWVSLVALPAALLGTAALWLPWGSEPLLWVAGNALELLLKLLGLAAQASPLWLPSQLPPWAWLLALCGALLLLLPRGLPMRWAGLPLLLQLGFAPLPRPPWGQAQVVQLDVGQGLAILIRTRDHALLFDAGPQYSTGDAGDRIVVPSLRRLGVRQLDTLVVSHNHIDHSGGAQAVVDALSPGRVLAGEPGTAPARWQAEGCEGSEPWTWSGVRFEPWRWPNARSPNPASCVLLVEANGQRLLLTGDIDAQAERALITANPAWTVDWLQVPHHGSRTSSSAALLNALSPRWALISRGWNNRFGHPHAQVSARLAERGIVVLDSARHGALSWHLGSDETPTLWRQQRRLWRTTGG
ncbi:MULTISPECIES: DNA internalization-related competence protein ComEC/Rec2 [Pseudomonas]|uniref:DNA internalization-related competence protein ComEC/Rec2 n=1 Tax=Pseudomonas quercus TaxID=2722792 RepID=A0ABX0YCV3_9PSED|nr:MULTISPECIES: DNA internalization-related competence protein ComEC/Rec2 [Pseudomonas]MBF7141540.1 DNA internalization-related competence protein ComEC/Rec2 [Pseudomonas sp. LY10J]NJP00079.1 DNA internalization-related competence protein ComEC/Rec2 [Pseudomonas quercus]